MLRLWIREVRDIILAPSNSKEPSLFTEESLSEFRDPFSHKSSSVLSHFIDIKYLDFFVQIKVISRSELLE